MLDHTRALLSAADPADRNFISALTGGNGTFHHEDFTEARVKLLRATTALSLTQKVFRSMRDYGPGSEARSIRPEFYQGRIRVVPSDHPTLTPLPRELADLVWRSKDSAEVIPAIQAWMADLLEERTPLSPKALNERGSHITQVLHGVDKGRATCSIWGSGNWDGNPKYTAKDLLDACLSGIRQEWRHDVEELRKLLQAVEPEANGEGYLQFSRRLLNIAMGNEDPASGETKAAFVARFEKLAEGDDPSRVIQALMGLRDDPAAREGITAVLLANTDTQADMFALAGLLALFDLYYELGALIEDRQINQQWSRRYGAFHTLLSAHNFKAYCERVGQRLGIDKPVITVFGAPSDNGMHYGGLAHAGLPSAIVDYIEAAQNIGYHINVEFGAGTDFLRLGGPRPVNVAYGLPSLNGHDLRILSQGGINDLWFANSETAAHFIANVRWVLDQKSEHNPELHRAITLFADLVGAYYYDYAGQMRRASLDSPWLEGHNWLKLSRRPLARGGLKIRAIAHTLMVHADGRSALPLAFISRVAQEMERDLGGDLAMLRGSRKFLIYLRTVIPHLLKNAERGEWPTHNPLYELEQQVWERDIPYLWHGLDINRRRPNHIAFGIRQAARAGGFDKWTLPMQGCLLESLTFSCQSCG